MRRREAGCGIVIVAEEDVVESDPPRLRAEVVDLVDLAITGVENAIALASSADHHRGAARTELAVLHEDVGRTMNHHTADAHALESHVRGADMDANAVPVLRNLRRGTLRTHNPGNGHVIRPDS